MAGKRQGEADDRFIWPEMLRVISEVKPRWIIGENVTGILNMGFDDMLVDLEAEGYETETLIIPACAVGAGHRRDRVWIVANARGNGLQGKRNGRDIGSQAGNDKRREVARTGNENVADSESDNERRAWEIQERQQGETGRRDSQSGDSRTNRWATKSGLGRVAARLSPWLDEPDIPRVAKGIPDRVNRLKGLGNAIVPQVAQTFMEAIKIIDERED